MACKLATTAGGCHRRSGAQLWPSHGGLLLPAIRRRSGFKAILVTPIDMPDLEVEHLQRLKAAWAQAEATSVAGAIIPPIVASFDHSFPQPLIGIYPTCFLDDMRQLTRTERRAWSVGYSKERSDD